MKPLPLKHKLFRKLHKEHGIFLETSKMYSFRRRGFGSRVVSWATIGQDKNYQSFETMANCLKYKTNIVVDEREPVITIEVNFNEIAS